MGGEQGRSILAQAELSAHDIAAQIQALRCGLDSAAWDGAGCAGVDSENYTETDRDADTPLPFDHARAHKLYLALFGQVEDLIKGKHLLIVPSGPLTQLPFQVLVTASPPVNGDGRLRQSAD